MKLGLIADIHGNIEALDAVIEVLEQNGADLIVCAGDLVAYGANPNSVIKSLKNKGIMSVAGNYDDAVAWDKAKASRKASSALNEPLKQLALDWTKQVIRPEHKQYLRGLPWQLTYNLKGKHIVVLHAGLNYLDEWLVPEDETALEAMTSKLGADVVVLAHTHQAFVQQVKDTLFINPGAVGRSLDGNTKASCALLNLGTLKVKHFRVEYDIKHTVEAIRKSGMPLDIALLVQRGARRIEEVRSSA